MSQEEYTENFLEGLVSPGRVNLLTRLLAEKRFDARDLRIIKNKIESLVNSGVNPPQLQLLQNEVTQQLYDKVILNNETF